MYIKFWFRHYFDSKEYLQKKKRLKINSVLDPIVSSQRPKSEKDRLQTCAMQYDTKQYSFKTKTS